MSTATSLPLLIATWFEARLHEAYVPHTALTRLYAVEVLDPEGLDRLEPTAARSRYVGEAPSATELLSIQDLAALDDDAAVLVTTRWVAVPGEAPVRPGQFMARRRARVVHVVTDRGGAAVARFDDDPHLVVLPAA